MERSLFKKLNYYYYIQAPGYNRTSGGNRVMHLLCHGLNLSGEKAYMVTDGDINNEWRTPKLNPKEGFVAYNPSISVYPEIYKSNVLKSTVGVRWLLSERYTEEILERDDMVYAFSSRYFPERWEDKSKLLCLPSAEPEIFYPGPKGKKKGSCFYVGRNVGIELSDLTKNSIEITRDFPANRQEMADLLRSCEVFYTYVVTGIIDEAVMCNTPVILLENEKMNKTNYQIEKDLTGGWGWGDGELEKAKKTLITGRKAIAQRETRFWRQLDSFIEHTQQLCRQKAGQL